MTQNNINSHLRSCLLQLRLGDLSVLSTEYDVLDCVDFSDVVVSVDAGKH